MRKRTMFKGGAVAVLIGGAALWLSGLLDGLGLGPGFGLGPGGGSGLGTGSSTPAGPVTPPEDLTVSHTDRVSVDEGEAIPGEMRVLEIVVSGDGYEVRRESGGEERFRSVDLARIKELAGRTAGNDEGIRVMISRRESSLPDAEIALNQALAEAGIEDSAIIKRDGLLPARGQ